MPLGCGIHIDQEYENKEYLRECPQIKLLTNLAPNSIITLSKTKSVFTMWSAS